MGKCKLCLHGKGFLRSRTPRWRSETVSDDPGRQQHAPTMDIGDAAAGVLGVETRRPPPTTPPMWILNADQIAVDN